MVNALKAIADKLDNQKQVSAETSEQTVKDTLSHREADALCTMAEFYIAGGSDDEHKSLAGYERCQVVLHMDVETLKHEHACDCGHHHHDKPHKAHYLDNHWITPANAKRLSCDASLLTAIEDEDGNLLNVGRNARTVTPQLRRALDIRDTTCRFPGCCESHYVDYHHIIHWTNGGETSKDNLIKLCRYHHDLVHEDRFYIEVQGNKKHPRFIFKTPDGNVIQPIASPTQTFDTTVEGSINDFEKRWPNINSDTITPGLWDEGLNSSVVINDMMTRTGGPAHASPPST